MQSLRIARNLGAARRISHKYGNGNASGGSRGYSFDSFRVSKMWTSADGSSSDAQKQKEEESQTAKRFNDLKGRHGAENSTKEKEDQRPRVLVIGSGWGGFNFVKDIDKEKYRVTLISPANHFLFTPLLPSSAVGTLEFRCIEEPVRTIKNLGFFQAKARAIDFRKREVVGEDIFKGGLYLFSYDYLVLAPGSKTNTFNTPGVEVYDAKGAHRAPGVYFLKNLYHAREIRNRILECFERAAIQDQAGNIVERDRLLSFVVVGGGPTSCEFVGELHDFINDDVARWYPDLKPSIKVTLVEASDNLLGTFDKSLAAYVMKRFQSRNINIRLGTSVTEYKIGMAILSDGTEIPNGMMVWSAGLKQGKLLSKSLEGIEKGPANRVVIDDFLRIPSEKCENRVFALGDCAVNKETPLPPLAQAARMQAKFIAGLFNKCDTPEDPESLILDRKPFVFFNLGSMASVGGWKGVLDFSHVGNKDNEIQLGQFSGFLSFIVWRFAYWGRQVSPANKMLIPMYWFKAFVFGRDISRF